METTALTLQEKKELKELECIIQKNFPGFFETGMALMKIRDAGLYRDQYKTFKEYCIQKWGISRGRAYQLIEHVEIQKNLSTVVDKENPPSEWVIRSLSKWLPEKQIDLYQRALKLAGGKKITSRHITKANREWKMDHGISDYEMGSGEERRLSRNLRNTWRYSSENIRLNFLDWVSTPFKNKKFASITRPPQDPDKHNEWRKLQSNIDGAIMILLRNGLKADQIKYLLKPAYYELTDKLEDGFKDIQAIHRYKEREEKPKGGEKDD